MKVCSTCKKNKAINLFPFQNKGKNIVMSSCKECRSAKQKANRIENPAEQKRKDKAHYEKNKGKRTKYARDYRKLYPDRTRNTNLKVKYGITSNEYDLMFSEQKGLCKICKKHQDELKRILCVDHCHATGEVRGLLCDTCNKFLGFYEKLSDQCKKYINKE